MCGINGIFCYDGGQLDQAELLRTRDHMAARGPDHAGQWISPDRRLGLGHRRLAIIDPHPEGNQPLATPDGRLRIVFNGEIYNYRELREELVAGGVRFTTHTDTEVLLELFRREGEAMLGRLRGMFAIAIWDSEANSLFLARDPYGIKPLYYADTAGEFRFASQVQALLHGRALGRSLEPAGLAGFLVWGSVPEPYTLYREIRALPSGHCMWVREEGPAAPSRYWELSQAIEASLAAAADIPLGQEREAIREALLDTVDAHLVADVPVGAFLSAGLDSSTLVGLAGELGEREIRTITLSSEEFGGNLCDEGPMAAAVAHHFGMPNQQRMIGIGEFEADMEAFLQAMDQPTIDGLNTWFVAKAAAETGLKVALSGLGGDELLGGYWTFRSIPRSVEKYAPAARIPLLGAAFLAFFSRWIAPYSRLDPAVGGRLRYGGTPEGAYLLERAVFRPWELEQVLDRDLAREGLARLQGLYQEYYTPSRTDLNPFAQVAYLEGTRYMRNQLLRDSDWTGMAHSLEIRVPLVDRVLTERIVGLAASDRLPQGKAILGQALARELPPEILQRPKTGFTIPIWKWLRKSPKADMWKGNRFLKRANIKDEGRWAYTLLQYCPDVAGTIK